MALKINYDERLSGTLTRAQWEALGAAARHLRAKRQREINSRPKFVPSPGKRHAGEEQVRRLAESLDIIEGVLHPSDKEAKHA